MEASDWPSKMAEKVENEAENGENGRRLTQFPRFTHKVFLGTTKTTLGVVRSYSKNVTYSLFS
jgi:hypothetical protein